MSHSNFILFKQQEAFNQASFQGHFGRTGAYLDLFQDESLRLWLNYLAKKTLPIENIRKLPEPYADCWLAWLAYNRGELSEALNLFMNSFKALDCHRDAALAVDVSLGLGRLYTRTGYFNCARGWLLYAGDVARQHDRLYDTVRSFGALGDLLVRAGYPQQALFSLNTAHQLLPPGAGERSRQMNYLATVLMRLDTPTDRAAAEDLLMQSYYLAQDTQDLTSMLHSLARLQFLYLDKGQVKEDIGQLLGFQQDYQPQHPLHYIPLGLLTLGRSLAAMQDKRHEQAIRMAEQACEYLKNYQAEYYWALSLCHFLQADKPLSDLAIPELSLHPAPESQSVINQLWQSIHLDDTGTGLFKPQLQQDSLIQHRQVFFI